MTLRMVSISSAVLVIASVAFARDVKIGVTTVTLTGPSGQCELQRSHPSDAEMLDLQNERVGTARGELLAAFADCTQLESARTGARKLLEDSAVYAVLVDFKDENYLRGDVISGTCRAYRSKAEKIWGKQTPDLKAGLEDVIPKLRLNEGLVLGVLEEDSDACYSAVLTKSNPDLGTEVTTVLLGANTTIKGKSITYGLQSLYVNAETVPSLLARHKVNVRALIAANAGFCDWVLGGLMRQLCR
jgi:hypothetical protein